MASSFERYLSNPGFEFNEQSHQWGSSTTLPATNLKPEDTRSWEIGLNARLWNHFIIDVSHCKEVRYPCQITFIPHLFERYSESRGVNVQFWPYGHQGLSLQNPYWIMKRMNRKTEKKRYMINASLTYKLTDWS